MMTRILIAISLLTLSFDAWAYTTYPVSTGSNYMRLYGALVSSSCTSSPCTITSQTGSWVSTIVRNSAGSYSATIASGFFTSTPMCVPMSQDTTASCHLSNPGNQSTTNIGVTCSADTAFLIMCFGQR